MRRGEDGFLHQDVESDKYNFPGSNDVDCASRIHACQAVCCRLPVVLSRQDVAEGIVRWDPDEPYVIRQEADGRCTHQDRQSGFCTIHPHRPSPCRAFSCRDDERIWLDFEQMIVNPAIHDPLWPFGYSAFVEMNSDLPE